MNRLLVMPCVRRRPQCSITTHTRQWRRGIFSEIGRTFMPGFGSRVKEHRVSRIVPFSPAQLYDVVADVSKYKRFVPYCEDSIVLRQPSPQLMMAQLSVGFTVFNEKYTSRVTTDRPNAIRIVAVDSRIFNSLESSWVFKPGPTPSSTHVDFSVRFEVTNPMASAAIDVVFADVVRKQIQAFEDRCTQVYGRAVGVKAAPPTTPLKSPPQSAMPSVQTAPAATASQPEPSARSLLPSSISQQDIEAALATACLLSAPASGIPEPSLIDLSTFEAACLALANRDSNGQGTQNSFGRLCADPALLAAVYRSTHALVCMGGSYGRAGNDDPAVSSPRTDSRKRRLPSDTPTAPVAAEQGLGKDYVAGSALSILMSEEDGSWSPLTPRPPPKPPAQLPSQSPPPAVQPVQVDKGWQRRRMAMALYHLLGATGPEARAAFLFDCLDREGRGSVTEQEIDEAVTAFKAALVEVSRSLGTRKARGDLRPAEEKGDRAEATVLAWAEGIEQGHTDSWEEAIKGWAQRASKRAGGRISREAWVVACAKEPMIRDWVPLDGLGS